MKHRPTPDQLKLRDELLDYFSKPRELIKCKIGCEDIVEPKKLVDTGVERLKHSKGKEFTAALERMGWYKEIIENEKGT